MTSALGAAEMTIQLSSDLVVVVCSKDLIRLSMAGID